MRVGRGERTPSQSSLGWAPAPHMRRSGSSLRGRGSPSQQQQHGRGEKESSASIALAAGRVTRNLTESFIARRARLIEDKKQKRTRVATRKAKLAFDRRAQREERKSQSSWRNPLSGWVQWNPEDSAGSQAGPALSNHGGKEDARACPICHASFWTLVKKRFKCLMCGRTVCGNCLHKIQLEPVVLTDEPVTEWICTQCFNEVEKEEEHDALIKSIAAAPDHPLVYYHGVVMDVVRTLSRHLPRYEASVLGADSVADCEEAGKLEAGLVELFKNFDIGLKKISSLTSESERDMRVQSSIKMALVGFLQENLARFRTLQSQRKSLMTQFAEEEKSGKRLRKSNRSKGGAEGEAPFIATIDPAMSSMAGAKISLTGSNFKPGTKVEIDGVLCRVKFMGPDRLIVYSPSLDTEGLKSILVTNPGGGSHALENVLLYSEEIGQPEPSPRTLQKSPATPAATDGSALPLAIDEALNASEVPLEEPVIRLIHPAICPIGGNTVLRIAGDHFCDQSVVRIGNKDAPVLSFDDTQGGESRLKQLKVRSPALRQVGFHRVEVTNPGGKRCRLDDVLFYTDDPALLDAANIDTTTDRDAGRRSEPAAEEPKGRLRSFLSRRSIMASTPTSLASKAKKNTSSGDDSSDSGKANAEKEEAEEKERPVVPPLTGLRAVDMRSSESFLPTRDRPNRLPTPAHRPPVRSESELGTAFQGSATNLISDAPTTTREPGPGRPGGTGGHARSVSFDYSIPRASLSPRAAPNGSRVLLPAPELSSNGSRGGQAVFWNVIDSEPPTSPSLSSSSSLMSSMSSSNSKVNPRLRWGTSYKKP